MGKINYGRVILGGIVAGIIGATLDWFFNGVLLGQLWTDTAKSLNRPDAFAGPTFLIYLYLLYIVGGTLMIWMYAAIRPRFGSGVLTAVYAGLVTWALAVLLPNVNFVVTGFFGPRITLYSTLFGVVGVVGGAIVGAALYKEAESSPASYPAPAAAHR